MLDFTPVIDAHDNPVSPQEQPAVGEVTPPAVAVAIFDLDGTLVVGQTTLLLVKFLRRVGIVSRTFLVGTGLWFLGYKAGVLRVSAKSREKGAGVFKGLTTAQVEQLMIRFTEEVLAPRFHPAATAALAEHLAEGDRVVVISAALEPIVKTLAARLGVTDYIGTGCEIVEGRYSGRLTGSNPHAGEKVRFALACIRESGADPADCWAYADHATDIALLEAVGHPVAVNPRPEMRNAAERAGWPILP